MSGQSDQSSALRHQFDPSIEESARIQFQNSENNQHEANTSKEDVEYKQFNLMDKTVYYIEAIPQKEGSGILFLMLHGKKFQAMTWVKETNSLKYLSEKGHRVVAVDIPGFGKGKEQTIVEDSSKSEFLEQLVQKVAGENEKVVLVTPSMSGQYALPFFSKGGKGIAMWVPVAPVGIPEWKGPSEEAQQMQVFAIYGELDPMTKDLDKFKSFFPGDNWSQLEIQGAEHPAYLKDPDLFNQQLDEATKKIS
eukprot:TRINITY_DN24624_c0_g1_i1.p1 TRINITY_DN24624_c0_g1~~TRINITY_DN24624_c0_g1_i1.p1  ORF type:complete len:250 (-),score=39.91 TRINITY_DN24624_c0_g1_i1:347-1096(-)